MTNEKGTKAKQRGYVIIVREIIIKIIKLKTKQSTPPASLHEQVKRIFRGACLSKKKKKIFRGA